VRTHIAMCQRDWDGSGSSDTRTEVVRSLVVRVKLLHSMTSRARLSPPYPSPTTHSTRITRLSRRVPYMAIYINLHNILYKIHIYTYTNTAILRDMSAYIVLSSRIKVTMNDWQKCHYAATYIIYLPTYLSN